MAEDLVRMWAEELDDDALARASITLEVVGDLNSTMDAESQQHLDAEGE